MESHPTLALALRLLLLSVALAITGPAPSSAANSPEPPAAVSQKLADYERADLTHEQRTQILDLFKSNDESVADLNKRIDDIRLQIADLFLQQEPDERTLLALQEQIDQLNAEIGSRTVKTVLAIRRLLTPEQRTKLVYGDPVKALNGATLTSEQKQRFKQIMQGYLKSQMEKQKALDLLEFEQKLLYQEASLDEAALLSKQKEINRIKNDMADEQVKLAAATRSILTPQQRDEVFTRHHPKVWLDTGVNARQQDDLMDVHMKIERADQEGRRKMIALSNDLASIYIEPLPDEQQALAKQAEADKAWAETQAQQIKLILEARNVLTSQQKQKLVALMREMPEQAHPSQALLLTAPELPGAPAQAPPQMASPRKLPAVTSARLTTCLIQHTGSARFHVKRPNTVFLNAGEILVRHFGPSTVNAGPLTLTCPSGAIILVQRAGEQVTVRALHGGLRPVSVIVPATRIDLLTGEEVLLVADERAAELTMKQDGFGRRRLRKIALRGGALLVHSEVSLVSLLQRDPLLNALYHRGGAQDRAVVDKVVKTAASLTQATSGHGPYRPLGR